MVSGRTLKKQKPVVDHILFSVFLLTWKSPFEWYCPQEFC